MADHRPSTFENRGPGVDLFDDPPWDVHPDVVRGPWAWLRHLLFVVFLVLLGLLCLLGVIAATSLVGALEGFHLNMGPLDFTPPPPSSGGMDIVLSADGSLAYVTEPDTGRLIVLDTATGRVRAAVTVGNDPTGLALSPDGSTVWVVNTTLSPPGSGSTSGSGFPVGSGSVSVVSTSTDQVVGTVPVGTGPIDVAFSPDGATAYVTDNGVLTPGSVSVIDTASLTVVGTLTPTTASTSASGGSPGMNPTSVAVTPDGNEVWVSEVDDLEGSTPAAGPGAGVVTVFDTADSAPLATIPVGTGPFFLALSADGREAYVADKGSCDVREIDTATFRVVATVPWPVSTGCPYGLAPGPTDATVYTVTGSDHTLNEGHAGNVFGSVDFTTGQARPTGRVGGDPVTLALSPGATTAYVVDADRPLVDLLDPSGDGATTRTFTIPD